MIRRLIVVSILLCCSATGALAQEQPKAEIFAGYAFARQGDVNINKGWNGSVAGNFNNWFGVVADFGGHYYSEDIVVVEGLTVVTANADANIHLYRFGPRFAMRTDRATAFAHVLVGGASTKVTGSARSGSVNFNISDTSTGFSGGAGGGVDIHVGRSLTIRAAQVDYVRFKANVFGEEGWSDGVRIAAGIVFRIK